MTKEAIVLVHGLWMNGMDMSLLRWRLQQAGYQTFQFSYPSVRHSLEENAFALNELISDIDAAKIHLVCHSLGGLVVRHFLHESPDKLSGRIVTLATPHQASNATYKLAQNAIGRLMLGKSTVQGLLGEVPAWNNSHELGSVAGTLKLGLGMIIPGKPSPNDGTIAVEETVISGMADHITLPVSHFGMLLSNEVVQQTCNFLQYGKFRHQK